MSIQDATERFSSRVENYVRYRPGYPPEIIDLLRKDCGLNADSVVADVAFGTGLFTRLLLQNGNRVFGVEPNSAMRQAGEKLLAPYPLFTSVPGSAENTTLPAKSVDIVTIAQAAHWFEAHKAQREFSRILKPGGWLVLIWNDRRIELTNFQRQYEDLIQVYGTDYAEVREAGVKLALEVFFGHSAFHTHQFEFQQTFDYPGLEGRLLSSSYAPQSRDAR